MPSTPMEAKITSTSNPKIKHLLRLHKASERKSEGLFLVEGCKEIQAAIAGGFQLHSLFINSVSDNLITIQQLNVPQYFVNEVVYNRITYGVDKEKILAVFYAKERLLDDLHLQSKMPLIVVLERVEKPGNLGAIMRTANAAGVDAVIVCDTQTDIYNP
ncbi:MAG: TrmH family RNA methyltransferase, partial [Bacteroidales bacterium]